MYIGASLNPISSITSEHLTHNQSHEAWSQSPSESGTLNHSCVGSRFGASGLDLKHLSPLSHAACLLMGDFSQNLRHHGAHTRAPTWPEGCGRERKGTTKRTDALRR